LTEIIQLEKSLFLNDKIGGGEDKRETLSLSALDLSTPIK